ncbi:hypothetical protein BOX15_Mlig007406g1, partial [Macrostomum lignano]
PCCMPNMTNFFKQFYLLQWKNIKLKQRQWAKTSIELVMPLVFFMILVAVRQSQNFIRSSPECDYRPTPLASDGLLAALRSACHLGVCQSSESVSRDETADGEWYGNASTALAAVNKLMAHRTTRLVASAALKALPTNWTDPDQVKQVPLKRLFTRPKDLFNGVNATDDEIRQLMSATVPLPKKLNLRLDFLLRSALLAQSMPSDVEAPQTVCILVASQSLCSQARFRSNLAQMFSPVQLVDQLASSDRDSIPLPIRFSDAVSLKPVISKLVSLKDAGVLNFLDDFWSRIAALEPATTASEATASPPTALAMLDRLERLSDVACGHGASTLRQITGRLRARLAGRARKPDTKHAGPEARPTLPPVGEADESGNSSAARRLVDLDAVELAQPEQFCFNASYQFALLGSVGSLLSSLGFDSLSVLAFGEIAYSPDTESVRRHLRRINETLTGIADVSRVAELWLTNETERAAQFLANGPLLPALQIFLSACPSPACQAAVAALSAESGSTAADGSFNDTEAAAAASNFSTAPWRRGLSWADWAARRLYYATACFRLSKLHGFANESALNARVEQLLRNYDAPPPSSDESPAASGPGPQRGPLPRAALLPKAGGGGGSGGSGSSGNGNETEGKDGELSEQMPHLLAALVFDSDSDTFVRYRLRMPEYAVDSTRHYKVLDRVWTPGPRAEFPQDFKYFTSFFIHLQELLELAIVSDLSGVEVRHTSRMRLFPSVCNSQDKFVRVIEGFLPMIMTLSWIYSISLLVNAIVYERETRMKELMRIMGLSDSVHWLSWLITTVTVMSISAVGMTALLTAGGIVRHSDPLLLFMFIFSFIVSSVCEAFLISVCFADSSVAAAFAGVVYFVGYVPYSAVDRLADSMTTGAYSAACAIPQLAFGIGCRYVAKWELAGVGLQAHNLRLSPMSDDAFAFSSVLLAMWLDAAWLFAAAAYLEQVFPGPYGVPRPLHFPFTSAFWRGERRSKSAADKTDGVDGGAALEEIDAENDKPLLNGGAAEDGPAADRFEEEPGHLPVGVAVRRLRKVYDARPPAARFFGAAGSCVGGDDETDGGGGSGLPVAAVDCLTVNFYQGQVTSFLGHNGAGKSTTISVLTGLYTPTSGTARIYGLDIRTQMDSVRRCLGLCPQHNILYDCLTVQDHIYFYGMLKGLTKAEIRPQVDSFLRDVGLLQKRHELSKNLSGGMKRRLSVAMAFVGNSKLVVLDEPTAGVDPHARRGIWEVIGKFRTGRTILLTTHHMDEADILGDRICIIDRGRLVCSGSPLFLKKALGDGYALTLVRSAEAPSEAAAAADAAALRLVRQEVPEARLAEATTSEIRLRLPASSAAGFAALFDRLDAAMSELGVSAYGIEDCSLEEVFLKVTGCTDGEEAAEENGDAKTHHAGESAKAQNGAVVAVAESDDAFAARATSLTQQARALVSARFHTSSRAVARWLAELLLPTGFVLLALALLQIVPRDGLNPPLELAPWYLLGTRDPAAASSQDLRTFVSLTQPGASAAQPLTRHLRATEQLGTRCMPPGRFSNPRFPCKWHRAGSAWSEVPANSNNTVGRCRCRPESAGGGPDCPARPDQPRRALMSGDLLEDLSGLRGGLGGLADYLRASTMPDYRRRFGGLRLFVENATAAAARAGAVDTAWRSLQLLGVKENNSNSFWSQLGRLSLPRPASDAAAAHQHEVWFDNRGYTAGPAYLNVLHNALLRSLIPAGNASAYGISAWTHPVTNRPSWASNAIQMNAFVSAMTVVSVLFALSFVLASFVIFPIAERRSGAKHLQLVSGVPPGLYWLVNHAWNLVNYLAPAATLLLLFAAFDSQEFVSAGSIGPTVAVLLLYGLACAPLMYLASWRLGVPSKAYTLLACANVGLGFVTTMSVTIVRMIGEQNDDKRMQRISEVLKWLFMVLPHFCLGHGLMELNIYYQLSVRLLSMAGKRGVKEYFSSGLVFHSSAWQPARNYIIALAIQSVVYFSAVLLIEYRSTLLPRALSRWRRNPPAASDAADLIDDDVAAEEARCCLSGEGGGNPDTALELRRLAKEFRGRGGRRIAAVRGVSLAVGRRECFGFLGVNGAGKTTTFRMLTGDLAPSSGDAFICGRSVVTEAREVHRRLGYCPQSDAVQPLLTGREVLQLYARIRGVPEHLVPGMAESIARQVGIMQHIDKVTEQYSGGNKRKLSCGVAFIGGPPILFLDEPTAGMDPKARRSLWRCIQGMVARGSCVILTSHSMEDCQALCHRLTIMVNGQLRCIGSPQYLKSKFGCGFTVYLRVAKPAAGTAPELREDAIADSPKESALADTEELQLLEPTAALTPEMQPAHAVFTAAFPGAELRSAHVCQLQYRLPGDRLGCRLAGLFAELQAMRKAGQVLDYSVTQTSLDQVFIDFASAKTSADRKEADEAPDGKGSQQCKRGANAASC